MSNLTLILGGARSGKSHHAQEMATKRNGRVVYIATAEAGDDEMRDRIARHRLERPGNWVTVEEPQNVSEVLASNENAAVILIDCLTFYITNHLLGGPSAACEGDVTWNVERAEAAVASLIAAALASPSEVIIVANELGLGLVPDYPLGRVFRDVAGRANQDAAAAADRVILMVAGIPMYVKGSPE